MTVKPVANFVPELMKALMRFKRASAEAEVIYLLKIVTINFSFWDPDNFSRLNEY
jgi:hypothetical protein